MTVLKAMIGSWIGTVIGIWFCRWAGLIPSRGFAAEQYFAEHYREIVLGLLTAGLSAAIIGCLIVLVYAAYRMARTIG